MTDFISQATLDSLDLGNDLLLHEVMANSIIEKAPYFPPGAVIAVQGPWGRGKTDVLARIAKKSLSKDLPHWMAGGAIWINPWQYATPDLLTPLVIELLDRVPQPRRSNNKSLRTAAETIIRAGANFGLKAASIIMPSGGLLKEAAGPIDDLLAGLFSALKDEEVEPPEADPVAKMADRFRELVQEVLTSRNANQNARLVICIDDLDRCLPDRQVAMLQALRFLTSTGASTTFLVALDPALARQAVVAHYGTTAFDPDRYLDKMFHLRVNLPALNKSQLLGLVSGYLEKKVPCPCRKHPLKDCLVNLVERFDLTQSDDYNNWWIKAEYGASIDELVQAFTDAMAVRDLRNPRIIDRIFQRLYLVAMSGISAAEIGINERYDLEIFIMWLGIIERWPDVRAAFQNADDDDDSPWGTSRARRLAEIRMHYVWQAEDQPLEHAYIDIEEIRRLNSRKSAIIERLPSRDQSPELKQMILRLTEELPHDTTSLYPVTGSGWQEFAIKLGYFDDVLVELGL